MYKADVVERSYRTKKFPGRRARIQSTMCRIIEWRMFISISARLWLFERLLRCVRNCLRGQAFFESLGLLAFVMLSCDCGLSVRFLAALWLCRFSVLTASGGIVARVGAIIDVHSCTFRDYVVSRCFTRWRISGQIYHRHPFRARALSFPLPPMCCRCVGESGVSNSSWIRDLLRHREPMGTVQSRRAV